MSKLVEHARRELELIGEDQDVIDWMVEVIDKFCEFGHSGGSASILIPRLNSLLEYRNLAPLTDDPAEWEGRTELCSEVPTWQSIRNPAAFSSDGGETFWLLYEDRQQDDGPLHPLHESEHKAR